jgi:hypothetical protein
MDVTNALQSAVSIVRTKLDPSSPSVLTDGQAMPTSEAVTSSFFNIPTPDSEQAGKLSDIYEFTKLEGATSEAEIVDALRDIRLKLGSPSDESLLEKMHRYVRVKSQAKSLEEQARAMER